MHIGIEDNSIVFSFLFNPGNIKKYNWNIVKGIVTISAAKIPKLTARSVSWNGEVVAMVTPVIAKVLTKNFNTNGVEKKPTIKIIAKITAV